MKKLHLLFGLIAILGLSACSSTVTQGELKKERKAIQLINLMINLKFQLIPILEMLKKLNVSLTEYKIVLANH